jgi:hypothetical protein
MAKLTQIAAGVVLAGATAFGAAKGYAHWRVNSHLEELARILSPYAELRWDGISTELAGSIEVSGVTIAPRALPEDIAIESVRLDTGDPRLLFSGLPRRAQETPEKLKVAVRGLRIPLSGSLLDSLEQGKGGKRADACGPAGMPGPAMLAAMGVPALELDVGADLEAPRGEGRMRLAFNYATRGLDQMDAAVAIGGVDQGLPNLREATVRYQPNAEAYARMTDYCARRRGSDREAYLRALAIESEAAFVERFGVAPGPGLRDAIARFLQQPGEVKVVLRPDAELVLVPGANRSLRYWIDAAGLALYVNGQLVEDLSVGPAAASAATVTADGETSRALSGAEREPTTTAAASGPASFRERPLADIGKFIDHRVRVHTRDGKPPREGRLKNVDGVQADIDQRHSGGHLVAHVRLEQISRLEVYTR